MRHLFFVCIVDYHTLVGVFARFGIRPRFDGQFRDYSFGGRQIEHVRVFRFAV